MNSTVSDLQARPPGFTVTGSKNHRHYSDGSGRERRKAIFTSVLTLILCVALSAIPQTSKTKGDRSNDLQRLVDSERAFARFSVEKGVRAAFLEYFADDGINFQPHPTKTREALLKRPAPTGPSPITLDWMPVFADISRDGTVGYTTGPYSVKDNAANPGPTRYGYYFSIWQKQNDGQFKVVIDCGIQTTENSVAGKPDFASASPSSFILKSTFDDEAEKSRLASVDLAFNLKAKEKGLGFALNKYLARQARLHRNGHLPYLDRPSIIAAVAGQSIEARTIYSRVASSADMGYTYGSYQLTSGSGKGTEKGYYVRVWKRDNSGKWKLALDTTSPVPPENKTD
jgi:ketosteroid isomerase-like protein